MTPDLLAPVAGCIRSDVWPRSLVVLHNVADGLIALAYLLIPASLLVLRHRRRDLIPVDWITGCFAAFILLCGGTHVMGAITAWWPIYRLDGVLKAATAGVSLSTAYLLQFRVMPQLLAIPSKEDREKAQRETAQAREDAERLVAELQVTNTKLSTALLHVEQRDAAIRALSTPVIPLGPKVVLSPLVGTVDSARADQLTTALLAAVHQRGATVAILDLTGVELVDTQVANVLLDCARSVALLGGRAVLSGMRPEVARTIVALGVDLSSITTVATLPDGIRLATKEGAR